MNDAIGWSDAEYLSRKMGELQPKLLRYVVGRSGDDYMLRVELLDLKVLVEGVLAKTVRADNHMPGRVIYPERTWSTGPVPGDTDVIIQTEEGRCHVARFVGQPGHWEVGGFAIEGVVAWRPL
jgi:hypothetical protein